MDRRFLRFTTFALLGLFLGKSSLAKDSKVEHPGRPRLAVVIVVDQMRSDYLDRFAGKFSGGLARLMRDGALYTQVYHYHSATETAPGHATISTGCFPSHHGIVGNEWYDQQRQKAVTAVGDTSFPLVGTDSKGGASPHHLQRPALGDWLKERCPKAKCTRWRSRIGRRFSWRDSILMAPFGMTATPAIT